MYICTSPTKPISEQAPVVTAGVAYSSDRGFMNERWVHEHTRRFVNNRVFMNELVDSWTNIRVFMNGRSLRIHRDREHKIAQMPKSDSKPLIYHAN